MIKKQGHCEQRTKVVIFRQKHSQMLKIAKFSHRDLLASLLGYGKHGNWHCFVQEVFTLCVKKGARNMKFLKAH